MNENRALALPAKTSGGRDRLFKHRASIDVRLLLTAEIAHHLAELLQSFEDHIVVVGSERVFRDKVARGRMRLVIVEADHYETAGLRHDLAGVGPAIGITGQPGHVAVHPVGDPLLKIVGADIDLDRGDAERIKAQRLRRSLESLAEGAGVHRA